MNSCLFEGQVLHSRKRPIKHQFWFSTFFFYLDLDELDRVFENRLLFSIRRFAFAQFRFSDHLSHRKTISNKQEMREEVLRVLRDHGISRPIGPIRLLTQLRYIGFVMNPVNFYFCFDESGNRVEAIITEVNNTPWGEQHLYVIETEKAFKPTTESSQRISANNVKKAFHVSPFMPLKMTYDFDFRISPARLVVNISSFENQEKALSVGMSLKQKPITSSSLRLALIKYPLISWKVFAGIYWHALRLYLKRVPFYPHPRTHDVAANNCHKSEAPTCDDFPNSQVDANCVDEKDSELISQ